MPFNDTTPNDVAMTPFATGVGGTISGKWDASEGNMTTLAAQLPNILTGHSYINFHTNQFTVGEIRASDLNARTPALKMPISQHTLAGMRYRQSPVGVMKRTGVAFQGPKTISK